MTPRLRKFALTAHVVSSVSWLGAVIGFLAHAIAGVISKDAQIVRAAYLMMELTGWFVHLSFTSLVTGLVQSLGTAWGLFRHYWIIVKLLITVFATVVLLIYMQTLDNLASLAAKTTFSTADLVGHHGASPVSPIVHASAAILLLLVCVVLSIYKPWGKTAYGQRKQA